MKPGAILEMNFDLYPSKVLESDLRDVSTKKQLENECCVSALQKRVHELENSFVEILKLEQQNDQQIYKSFQYKTWDKLPPLVSKYLLERYGFTFAKRGTLRWLEECYKKPIKSSECIGESFDRYKLEFETNDSRVKKCLADLTSAQLSEVMEAVIDVLNKKKEQEEPHATV